MNQPPVRKTVGTIQKSTYNTKTGKRTDGPVKPFHATAISAKEFVGAPRMTAKPGMATPKRHKMMRAPGVGRR